MTLNKAEALTALLRKGCNLELVGCLNGAGVEFLVIGGTALAFHGCRDLCSVDDLDLLVAATADNADRIESALQAAHLNLEGSKVKLTRPRTQMPIKSLGYYAELLTPDQGYDFEAMRARALQITICGQLLYIASTEDLLRMKQDAASAPDALPKHQQDLERLKAL